MVRFQPKRLLQDWLGGGGLGCGMRNNEDTDFRQLNSRGGASVSIKAASCNKTQAGIRQVVQGATATTTSDGAILAFTHNSFNV